MVTGNMSKIKTNVMVINYNCSPWFLLVSALVGVVCQLVDVIYPKIIEIQKINTLTLPMP